MSNILAPFLGFLARHLAPLQTPPALASALRPARQEVVAKLWLMSAVVMALSVAAWLFMQPEVSAAVVKALAALGKVFAATLFGAASLCQQAFEFGVLHGAMVVSIVVYAIRGLQLRAAAKALAGPGAPFPNLETAQFLTDSAKRLCSSGTLTAMLAVVLTLSIGAWISHTETLATPVWAGAAVLLCGTALCYQTSLTGLPGVPGGASALWLEDYLASSCRRYVGETNAIATSVYAEHLACCLEKISQSGPQSRGAAGETGTS